mmetsp:Transcript_13848/g.34151  ORF Transcript_13848/g.34151 Transcript_13848/m.34151 type:complete len:1160 (+) Transcript_13848:349-3828(+)
MALGFFAKARVSRGRGPLFSLAALLPAVAEISIFAAAGAAPEESGARQRERRGAEDDFIVNSDSAAFSSPQLVFSDLEVTAFVSPTTSSSAASHAGAVTRSDAVHLFSPWPSERQASSEEQSASFLQTHTSHVVYADYGLTGSLQCLDPRLSKKLLLQPSAPEKRPDEGTSATVSFFAAPGGNLGEFVLGLDTYLASVGFYDSAKLREEAAAKTATALLENYHWERTSTGWWRVPDAAAPAAPNDSADESGVGGAASLLDKSGDHSSNSNSKSAASTASKSTSQAQEATASSEEKLISKDAVFENDKEKRALLAKKVEFFFRKWLQYLNKERQQVAQLQRAQTEQERSGGATSASSSGEGGVGSFLRSGPRESLLSAEQGSSAVNAGGERSDPPVSGPRDQVSLLARRVFGPELGPRGSTSASINYGEQKLYAASADAEAAGSRRAPASEIFTFRHCTDDRAVAHLEDQLAVENLDLEKPPEHLKEKLLPLLAERPQNQGDAYLRLLLKFPEKFGTSRFLVSEVLRNFYRTLWSAAGGSSEDAQGRGDALRGRGGEGEAAVALTMFSGAADPAAFLEVGTKKRAHKETAPTDGKKSSTTMPMLIHLGNDFGATETARRVSRAGAPAPGTSATGGRQQIFLSEGRRKVRANADGGRRVGASRTSWRNGRGSQVETPTGNAANAPFFGPDRSRRGLLAARSGNAMQSPGAQRMQMAQNQNREFEFPFFPPQFAPGPMPMQMQAPQQQAFPSAASPIQMLMSAAPTSASLPPSIPINYGNRGGGYPAYPAYYTSAGFYPQLQVQSGPPLLYNGYVNNVPGPYLAPEQLQNFGASMNGGGYNKNYNGGGFGFGIVGPGVQPAPGAVPQQVFAATRTPQQLETEQSDTGVVASAYEQAGQGEEGAQVADKNSAASDSEQESAGEVELQAQGGGRGASSSELLQLNGGENENVGDGEGAATGVVGEGLRSFGASTTTSGGSPGSPVQQLQFEHAHDTEVPAQFVNPYQQLQAGAAPPGAAPPFSYFYQVAPASGPGAAPMEGYGNGLYAGAAAGAAPPAPYSFLQTALSDSSEQEQMTTSSARSTASSATGGAVEPQLLILYRDAVEHHRRKLADFFDRETSDFPLDKTNFLKTMGERAGKNLEILLQRTMGPEQPRFRLVYTGE